MFEEIACSLPMGLRGLWMAPQTPGTAPRGAPDAPQDASPNAPRSQNLFRHFEKPYMFEERAFSLPMDFEGLWMGPQTPGTAPRGAPDASRTASRALKSLPRQVHNGPEWPQDGSGGRQDGSRWSQGAPEHQRAPTTPPRDSKRSRTRPQRLPRGPRKKTSKPNENLAYLKK